MVATVKQSDFFEIFDIGSMGDIYDIEYKFGPSIAEDMLDSLEYGYIGHPLFTTIKTIGHFEIGDDFQGNVIVVKKEEEIEEHEEAGLF